MKLGEMRLTFRFKGGKGSGHRGHAGRPGMVGGSLPGTGVLPPAPGVGGAIVQFAPMGRAKGMEYAKKLVRVVGEDGVTLSDPTDVHLKKYANVFAKQDERMLAAVDEVHVAEDKHAWHATLRAYNEAFDESMTPGNVYAFYVRRTGAGEVKAPHGLKNVMEFPHRTSDVKIGHEIGHAAYFAATESAQADWVSFVKSNSRLSGDPRELFADMCGFYTKYRGKPATEPAYGHTRIFSHRHPDVYAAVSKVLETMR